MKSFRRTQVFTANIAKIANVPKRNRGSGKVVNAKTPSAVYAANAIANLFVTTDPSLPLGISPADSRFAHAR